MTEVFYIVGPTASGKSEIAATVAERCNAEIVGADAFQLYAGLPRLTAQPDAATLARVLHHLIGTFGLAEEMSAAEFAQLARGVIAQIQRRGRRVIVVGGSGLYVRALVSGFSPLPPGNPKVRERLEQLSLRELNVRLRQLDPGSASTIDVANRRRVIRAVEICLLTGKPASSQRVAAPLRIGSATATASGVFVFRDRDDLYQRINLRVEQMFASGVVEEVKAIGEIGKTASQTLGLRQICELLDGKITVPECIAAIQQATRHYAKRQLTWFGRQTNFAPLNLTDLGTPEAIEQIAQRARLSFAQ
jgi:tRNA dimethylallyltransferase